MTDDPRQTCPLPEEWSRLEVVEDRVVADGVELWRAGMATSGPSGEEVVGSAADPQRSPVIRSYCELVERIAVLEAIRESMPLYELRDVGGEGMGAIRSEELFPLSDAPAAWRFAKSNGVAIHHDWQSATQRALWELAERDRILRAWLGVVRPVRTDFDFSATPFRAAQHYDFVAYEFPERNERHFSFDISVAGIFGFPTTREAPFIAGFAARDDGDHARAAACAEAMQSLAFLWGEPVATEMPPCGPTPIHHLEHFQYPPHHDILRRWLDGGHERFSANDERDVDGEVRFVDLTPAWCGDRLRVAKAICRRAIPLAFGSAPFLAHLPTELRVHPIA